MSVVDETQFALAEYPGFLPGFAVSIIVAMLAHRPVARRLGARDGVAWLLILSLGAVMAATLTPGGEAISPIAGPGCDLSRVGPAPWADYTTINTTSMNVLLFVPLGVAIGLLPPTAAKLLVLAGSLALPVAIEMVQLVAAPLDRACQGADVFDNMMGLTLGLAAGSMPLFWIRNA